MLPLKEKFLQPALVKLDDFIASNKISSSVISESEKIVILHLLFSSSKQLMLKDHREKLTTIVAELGDALAAKKALSVKQKTAIEELVSEAFIQHYLRARLAVAFSFLASN